jgi:nucleotide-binding universal stress UspA family protein
MSMTDILVPIINPGDAEWAANQAIALNRQKPVLAHLLSVRHALPVHITQFFGRGDLRSFYQEAGLQVLAPAMQLLEQAGVRYEPHVLVGRPAQSIVKLAKQLGDVPIILPQRREGLLSSLGMGSIGSQVRQLMQAQSA